METITKEFLASIESVDRMWRLMFARLDHLRIHFLLERLAVERGHENRQKLLDVSRETVAMVTFIWLQRDRTAGRYHDFDYIVGSSFLLYSDHTSYDQENKHKRPN